MKFFRAMIYMPTRQIAPVLGIAALCLGAVVSVRAQQDEVCQLTPAEPLFMEHQRKEKIDKQYPEWGVVKRPGVQMPITTLYNTHTRELLPIFEHTAVKPELLKHFFRCRGFGETIDMAPELLDTILGAATEFKSKRVTIISGYRSAKFNDTLAKKGRRVAEESRHMRGQAVDFRTDTVDAVQLGSWLKKHFEGGVGIYKNDNFVHIDVGQKRTWQGY